MTNDSKNAQASADLIAELRPFAWTDDGTTRAGSGAHTSHRVITDATKAEMPAAVRASFSVPLAIIPEK